MKRKGMILFFCFIFLMSLGIIVNQNLKPYYYPVFKKDGPIKVIVDGNNINYNIAPEIIDNNIMMPLDILIKNFTVSGLWQQESGNIVLTSFNKVIRLKEGHKDAKINFDTFELSSYPYFKDGIPLVPLKDVKDYYNIEGKLLQYNKDILMISKDKGYQTAELLSHKVRVRQEPRLLSPVVDFMNLGEKSYIYEQTKNGWIKIVTERGHIGYIKINDEISIESPDYKLVKDHISEKYKNKKINLTWDAIYGRPRTNFDIPDMEGLNVVSPTWFHILDEEGAIDNLASLDYVNWAKDKGYDIWGLFSNNFNPDITSVVLNDWNLREKVINNILDLHMEYKLDGINIDFENVYLKDRDMLTQFVRELAPLFREKDLIVSMDVTAKSLSENWSLCYDRRELGKTVDYLALMAYDEHWAGSPTSGSVASLKWVESGIRGLLEDVSQDKLLLGIPFYTREWKETINKDGSTSVTSSALSMMKAENNLKLNNASILFDHSAGQNYGEYRSDGHLYRIWLEDELSISSRIELVHKYKLAGISSWRMGFEKEDIWTVINNELNK